MTPAASARSGGQVSRDARPELILRFDAVSKSYQGHLVLREFSLDMRRGEFLTLLGPSGCGKTTSLNLVAGLLRPDTGTIYLRGGRANTLSPRRRELGLVFQSWALFPHLTIFENVAYGLRVRGMQKAAIQARVEEMLALVRLPNVGPKYPSQLSGGMQQRVALARALVPRPDLLLLDEPLSNLDAALRKEMQVELRRIHDELGVSTLLVTHSQEEALVMSDRIAVMRQGRIESLGTPDGIYNRPPTRFVCTFVGDANLFDCQVTEIRDGQAWLDCKGLRFCMPASNVTVIGKLLTIAVRPESIIIQRPHANTCDGNEAVITGVTFKGSVVEYRLTSHGEAISVLALPTAVGGPLAIGDRVRLGFPPDRVIPLAPDEVGDVRR